MDGPKEYPDAGRIGGMGIDKIAWHQEQEYLQRVMEAIEEELAESKEWLDRHRKSLIETRASLWQGQQYHITEWEDVIHLAAMEREVSHETRGYVSAQEQVHRLERAKVSPFFARVDFHPNSSEAVMNIYIGFCTVGGGSLENLLVYDWRSSIAGLFYDFELGPATYDTYDGSVAGTIALKRQFKIRDGQIEYMFDSGIKVDDEVLQQVLSRSVDEKMRNIVTTIQREQNRAIRDEKSRLLIVQGAAGSGKTSVALHRAAYLLYKHRNRLNAHNILIFSPNDVFNDYISAVLPELGEENVIRTTFHEYIEKVLGPELQVQTLNEQMESVLTEADGTDKRLELSAIEYKSSAAFIDLLHQRISFLETDGVSFTDVFFAGKTIVTGVQLERLFTEQYLFLPVKKRLEKIWRRVIYLLKPHRRPRFDEIRAELAKNPPRVFVSDRDLIREAVLRLRQERKAALAEIKRRTHFSVSEFYKDLFRGKGVGNEISCDPTQQKEWTAIGQLTIERLEQGYAPYEDAMALLYLKANLEGVQELSGIRHLIIDEAQDYSRLHYEIIRRLFPNCRITLLGDLNQSIYPYAKVSGYEAAAAALGVKRSAYIQLQKSYRSTAEIVRFTRALLPAGEDIEPIERSGDKPTLVRTGSRDQIATMATAALGWRDQGVESIAFICRTAEDSRRFYEQLRHSSKELTVSLVTADDSRLSSGPVVIPSYLAKGLEFDAVLVPDVEQYGEQERNLLYTVCTRALHHLSLYYRQELPPLLQEIDPSLYKLSEY